MSSYAELMSMSCYCSVVLDTPSNMDLCTMKLKVVIFVISVCIVKSELSESAEHKVVETSNGKVRGIRRTTLIKKVDFYSFIGIPYAKIPTGELRFRVSFRVSRRI